MILIMKTRLVFISSQLDQDATMDESMNLVVDTWCKNKF